MLFLRRLQSSFSYNKNPAYAGLEHRAAFPPRSAAGMRVTEVRKAGWHIKCRPEIKIYDAARNPITVTYDMLGRKTELTTKDGGAKRYTYDGLHLLYEDDAVMRQSGSRVDYSYDGFNRVVKIAYPKGGDVEYEYGIPKAANNSAGKVVSVRNEAGETRYEYGKLGEVTKETRTLKRHIPAYESEKTAVMEYVSDYLGRMQRITYPDREVVTYGYDAGGQVCSIKGDHDGEAYTYVADIGYDEYGQRVYIKYGNGVETNYTYDENMRWLKHIDTQNTYGTQYQNIDYSFDDVGNVEKYTNNCMNGSRYSTQQTYTYDALYQLISATGTTEDNPYAIPGSPDYSSTYTQDFSFDAIGNMTQKKSEETITPAIQKKGGDDLNYEFTYQYDENYAHRLTRAGSEQKGWRYYTYDANGNVTSESDGVAPDEETTTLTPVTVTTQTNEAGDSIYEADYAWAWPWGASGNSGNKPVPNNKRRYEWNSRNLLMRSVNSVYDTRYVYAADGNRAAKWTATKSSETLYFNTMWTWHTDKGLPEGQYSKHIYLGETRVVTKQTSKLEASYGQSDEWHHQYYYHPDHLGSAQLVTDYEGNEYQRIEYTPYGELWVEKKTEKEEGLRYLPYKFTAKEQDEETGLYYYGARYLDAKYSRWMSTDPAVSEYIPMAPVNDEARKHNEKLPGQGGIFNTIAFNLFNYANNNPVKYSDPTGEVPVKPWAVLGTNTHKEIQRYLKSTYKGSSPFYLPSPNPGKKGCFFVDYQRVNTDKKREFYEIKPISYMSNKKGDKQLDKYIARYGEGAVKGMEILDDLNGVEISTNIMSSNPMDFSGKITLYTDKANHPGMIFYSLDDGKTKEEKQKDIVKKGLSLLVGIGLFLLGTGVQPRMPVNPVPAP